MTEPIVREVETRKSQEQKIVTEIIEGFLKMAMSGQIQAVAICGVNFEGGVSHQCYAGDRFYELMGAIEEIKFTEYLESAKGNGEL